MNEQNDAFEAKVDSAPQGCPWQEVIEMPYEEINGNIDRILGTIGPADVAQYDWLIQNIHQVAQSEYQRRYKAFWRLSGAGLSQTYCRAYFQFLQAGLNNNVLHLNNLAYELYQIPINTNRQALQFSFCTKLCHMLNRVIPIYDSRIRTFYNFVEPLRRLPIGQRIAGYVQFHQFLINEYNRVLNEGLLAPSIQAFRQHLGPQRFTDIKVIDSLIWSFINYQEGVDHP